VKDRPRAIAVLVAVFLAGCILGSAGSYSWLRWQQETRQDQPADSFPSRRQQPERWHLPTLLELTPEQNARYSEIMAESRRELDGLRSEQAPKIREIIMKMNRRISEILTEEQRRKFDDYIREVEHIRKRSSGRRGGADRPPKP